MFILLFVLFLFLIPFPSWVYADPYFNSAETGCNPASPAAGYVLCDDFDDGNWAVTCGDPDAAANDGWLLCNDLGERSIFLPSATCGSAGAVGTTCTATSSPQGGDGGFSQLGMHGFYPANATYDELYVRLYLKLATGYVTNNNQKFVSYIKSAYQGGIDIGGGPTRNLLDDIIFAASWDCDDNDYHNPQNSADTWCYLHQNQGTPLTIQTNHWYYIEWYVKNNTYSVRNGLLKVWINDCGTNGLGCTGTPTLRHNYTNLGWRGQGAGTPPSPNPSGFAWGTPTTPLMGSMWFDIWGNPADVGTIYIDQIIASTVGPIGFVGEVPTQLNAPSGLQVTVP